MICVNIFGGPSSGKTTTAAGLFHFMKLNHINVELIPEYAKSLLYSNRLEDMQDQQEYIFAKQNHMLHRLREKVEYAIVDSPTLLSYCYTTWNAHPWPARDAFKAFVWASFNTYNNLNIYLIRPDEYQTEGRLQTLEQARQIDDNVVDSLRLLGVHHVTVKADEYTVDNIMELVRKQK